MSATASAIRYRRPRLYAKQRAFLFTPARYSVTEASTKSGKTVGCIAWLFEQAAVHGRDGRNYWWVAPTFAVAKIAYRRMKRAVPRPLYHANETELTLTLANGAVIWFKGADKPDTLYGEDVYAAVIDEATRCKEEAWYAVRSTLTATRGPVRVIGNVKGRKNWAYNMARKAESGAPDMAYFKLTAYDAVEGGVLALAEVEDAKRALPEHVFRELYLAEPADDEGNPFGGSKAIRACVAPLSGQPSTSYGWDLAKSVDWVAGVGLDAQGRTAYFDRWQGPWETTENRIRSQVGGVRALVDSSGNGDRPVELLQKGRSNIEGFKFTGPSKQQLMEGLAVAISSRAITYPDGPIVQELETFEYEYTKTGVRYSAPEGLHDDCVMALALAVRLHTLPRLTAAPQLVTL